MPQGRSDRRLSWRARALIAGLVVLCVVLWLLHGAIEPDPGPTSVAPVTARPVTSAVLPAPPPTMPELPRAEPPALRGHDTVDPCSAGIEPTIPPTFEVVTIDAVTVAWLPGAAAPVSPYDVGLQPTAVGHLIQGLLAEAAALTGTFRRERIAVIVYPSREALHAATGGPGWAGGVYDGGAVHIAASPTDDLGVGLGVLRHELMHAQLHAAVGCMPSWFNEGLAMYFAGAPPIRPWLKMLRSPDGYDLRTLIQPFDRMTEDQAERAYAESLAMIVAIIDRAGELGLRNAVLALRTASRDAPRAGLELWDRLYPGAGHRDVLDALAHKVLGAGSRNEVDRLFRGVVCCSGLRAVADFKCHSVAARPDRRRWIDQTSSPRAACDATW